MEKIICKLLNCQIPEEKHAFEDFEPYIRMECMKRFALGIAYVIVGIIFAVLFQSWKLAAIIALVVIWFALSVLMFYWTFQYDAYQFVDVECMGVQKELNRNVQYFKNGNYIYKMACNRNIYTLGSIIRIYVKKQNVQKRSDGTIYIYSPLCVQVLKKNIDSLGMQTENSNQNKKKFR